MTKGKFAAISEVSLEDGFLERYSDIISNKTIFEQWDIFCDEGGAKGHSIRNFRILAGLADGDFKGFVFQDSDLYKWLEAAGNILKAKDDPRLRALVDECIDLISKAQQDDGYINTYFSLVRPDKKLVDLQFSHELYTAGHFFEAVVSVYEATKCSKLLDIAKKFGAMIERTFCTQDGQIDGADGHQEIELALCRLSELTGDDRYRQLARFFLDTRGKEPNFYYKESEVNKGAQIWTGWFETHNRSDHRTLEHLQGYARPIEQERARGHAVRLVYQLTGMAAAADGIDDPLYIAAERMFDNIITKQMYITGGIGQTNIGESFSADYDLPLVSAYAETCASIGLAMAARQLMRHKPKAVYAKIMERAIYNTVLAGISLDCDRYFYVNPQEANPLRKDATYLEYIKYQRQEWHGCACCPPNLSRFLTSTNEYIYLDTPAALYVNMLVSSSLDGGGNKLKLVSKIAPKTKIDIKISRLASKTLRVITPDYLLEPVALVNGELKDIVVEDGFLLFDNVSEGDTICIKGKIEPTLMRADDRLNYMAGKIAVRFGPYIMCAEEVDNGANLHNLIVSSRAKPKVYYDGAIPKVKLAGYRQSFGTQGLYFDDTAATKDTTTIILVPYYYWANRGEGEMAIWLRKDS